MNSLKRVIVYCRESRDENGEKIERIETQRDILLAFCKRNNLTNIINVVMDNNVSGTKFERLNEIVEMIKSKSVDVLVFKDASRLGRNLLESLKFIELADYYGVEVIFESEKYDEELFPLKAWFNEQRAREDSKKIRRVLMHKMETGELVIRPMYGYKKVDKKLVPDPITAPIVKRVFELYVDGNGTRKIATILNYEGIPTPSQYNQCPVVSSVWIQQQIYRIISNRAYIGEMIYRKNAKKSYKSKKVTKTHPSERIIIEEHHEAIISRELFKQAQLVRQKCGIKTSSEQSLFSGIIKCGRCGRSLIRRKRSNNESYYECIKYNQEGNIKTDIRENYGCISHRLYEKDVKKIIFEYCKKLIINDDCVSRVYSQADSNNDINKTITKLRREKSKCKRIISAIYDDKLIGFIGENLYLEKSAEYQERLDKLDYQLYETNKMKRLDKPLIKLVMSKLEENDLNNFILKLMLNKIVYYLPKEITDEDKNKISVSEECYKLLQDGGLLFYFR